MPTPPIIFANVRILTKIISTRTFATLWNYNRKIRFVYELNEKLCRALCSDTKENVTVLNLLGHK